MLYIEEHLLAVLYDVRSRSNKVHKIPQTYRDNTLLLFTNKMATKSLRITCEMAADYVVQWVVY